MSLGLVSEADYKLMKAAFLGMEDEATSMDKKDVAEDLKVQKEMEADGRPLWFQVRRFGQTNSAAGRVFSSFRDWAWTMTMTLLSSPASYSQYGRG